MSRYIRSLKTWLNYEARVKLEKEIKKTEMRVIDLKLTRAKDVIKDLRARIKE